MLGVSDLRVVLWSCGQRGVTANVRHSDRNAVASGKGRHVVVSPLRGQSSGVAWGIPLPTWPQAYNRELRKKSLQEWPYTKLALKFSVLFSVPAGLPQGKGCTKRYLLCTCALFWGRKRKKEKKKIYHLVLFS